MSIKLALSAALACVALGGCVSTSPAGSYPNPSSVPTYGTVTLNAGQRTAVEVIAGGEFLAQNLSPSCRGYIYGPPDFVVNAQTNGASAMLIAAVSDLDTTLVVSAPNGWYCGDDTGDELHPSIIIPNAPAGRYAIWVGTYNSGYGDALLGIDWAGPRTGGGGGGGGNAAPAAPPMTMLN